MKLSNKILIGFFGFIFLYLTAVFAEVRLNGTPNIINASNSISETKDLPGIAYLVLHDLDKTIHVTSSDKPRLEVLSFSGDMLKELKYTISSDTLTLLSFLAGDAERIKISVFVPQTGFKGIVANNATVIVGGLQQDFLFLSQNAGHVEINDNRISKLQMDVSNKAYMTLSANLDTLSATIDESQIYIGSFVDVLQGSMKNSARLHLDDIRTLQFSKDESSRLSLYQ